MITHLTQASLQGGDLYSRRQRRRRCGQSKEGGGPTRQLGRAGAATGRVGAGAEGGVAGYEGPLLRPADARCGLGRSAVHPRAPSGEGTMPDP